MSSPERISALSLLTFREVRGFIRRSHCIAMTVFFGLLYAIGSMVLGSMLVFTRVPGPSSLSVIWSPGSDPQTWNFPALVFTAPWGYVSLPFLATWVTILVSVGVAMGTSTAILLVVALVKRRREGTSGPSVLGSAAGLTPAMLALVTLGACCGTTAAATAGIGVVAQITGTTTANLLYNNWFLGVFQVAVVWIALFAQELLLRVYGDLIGIARTTDLADRIAYQPPRLDRRFAVGCVMRAGLLIAGVSWSLAMLVAWTTTPVGSASASVWASWLLQYELLGILAIVAALFPRGLGRALTAGGRWGWAWWVRGVLLLSGLSLAIGTPAPLPGWGFEGLLNEVAYVTIGPSAWAAAPVFGPGLALFLRWGGQYLLLGGFAIALALAPERTLRPIRWTVGTLAPSSVPAVVPSRPGGTAHPPGESVTAVGAPGR